MQPMAGLHPAISSGCQVSASHELKTFLDSRASSISSASACFLKNCIWEQSRTEYQHRAAMLVAQTQLMGHLMFLLQRLLSQA